VSFRPSAILLHWTVSGEHTTEEDVRKWHRARGLAREGYHGMVARLSTGEAHLYAMRDDEIQGAHAKGWGNRHALGLAVAWRGQQGPVPDDMVGLAVGQCVAWCLRYGISPDQIMGHRDAPGASTECPGVVPVRAIREATQAALAALREQGVCDAA